MRELYIGCIALTLCASLAFAQGQDLTEYEDDEPQLIYGGNAGPVKRGYGGRFPSMDPEIERQMQAIDKIFEQQDQARREAEIQADVQRAQREANALVQQILWQTQQQFARQQVQNQQSQQQMAVQHQAMQQVFAQQQRDAYAPIAESKRSQQKDMHIVEDDYQSTRPKAPDWTQPQPIELCKAPPTPPASVVP